jgi:hemolysin activation/secretion protein
LRRSDRGTSFRPAEHLLLSQFQLYGFADYGKLWTRDAAVGTPASPEAASAGAGVRLGWQNFSADLQASKGIEGPRNDWRFFFVVAAKY